MGEEPTVYKLIEMVNDRITDLNDRFTDLSRSFNILNDHHSKLDKEFTSLRTEIRTTIRLVKWVVTPTAIGLLLAKLGEIWRAA